MLPTQRIYSGTSGLVLPITRDAYSPAFQGKSRLEYYSSLFNSVEINSSFYKIPQASTVKKWAESVPENFRFTFKLPKMISHAKDLAFDSEELKTFMETTDPVGHKKGCVLIQLPP